MDGDQADLVLRIGIAKGGDDAGLGQAVAAPANDLEADQITIAGIAFVAGRNIPVPR